MFKNILPEDKKYLSEGYENYYKKYYINEGHFMDTTVLFDNVKNTIDNFKKQGFYMAVASSKPKRILDRMVSHFNLSRQEVSYL